MNRAGAICVVGGLGALGLVALIASPRGRSVASRVVERGTGWIDRVIARVSHHEGRYDSLNPNRDGAGLSFGVLQWAQKTGDLGRLLSAMRAADPASFQRIFDRQSTDLLRVTSAASLAPVGGAVLWAEPWLTRFTEAGRWPAFRAVQDALARQGGHFQGALAASRALGVATERAVALFLDTSVQQGPGAAEQLAREVKAALVRSGRRSAPYGEVLTVYAQRAADRFRRATPPTRPYGAPHIEWRKTGDEWHAWAGTFDLYAGVLRRRMAIVADRTLGDSPVEVA